MMDFTREEIKNAHLILVVDSKGAYKWSSRRSDFEVKTMLHKIATEIATGKSKRENAGT